MGNHKFRLSDMIPNSWFQKLKYMGRIRNQNTTHSRKKKPPPTSSKSTSTTSSTATYIPPKTEQPKLLSHRRKSYYFTRELTPPSPQPKSPKIPETHFQESPRKAPKPKKHRTTKKGRNRVVTTSSVSTSCPCRATVESISTNPDLISEDYPISSLDSSSENQSVFPEFCSDHDNKKVISSSPSSCQCRLQNNIVINPNEKKTNETFHGFVQLSRLELPPIVTKKPKFPKEFEKPTNQLEKPEKQRSCPVRSPGLRLRTKSPRIASRKIQAFAQKSMSSSCRRVRGSLSESFAVVKTSADPQRDFRESMVEMILENNLRASKDLEDLLACYLQLNSDEYHELIVEVFKQIWFDIAGVKVK
ncbi:hypothetical protein RHSIM_Rhsim05G0229400 [Rhododendron simsii]|uniref:Transcription repressor n=1 Tax=Rhododendron simsii TaxID=118357 RepID=A0A834H3U5_RHOSS|nr:hypothetical protein RHSIM_Rhsim05G0229400 [Rhododendron simsii]